MLALQHNVFTVRHCSAYAHDLTHRDFIAIKSYVHTRTLKFQAIFAGFKETDERFLAEALEKGFQDGCTAGMYVRSYVRMYFACSHATTRSS